MLKNKKLTNFFLPISLKFPIKLGHLCICLLLLYPFGQQLWVVQGQRSNSGGIFFRMSKWDNY